MDAKQAYGASKGYTDKKINAFPWLGQIQVDYAPNMVIDSSFVEYTNLQNQTTQYSTANGWAEPFTYNGEIYVGVVIPSITLLSDTDVTVSIKVQPSDADIIATASRKLTLGTHTDVLFPIAISNLSQGAVYYVTIQSAAVEKLAVGGSKNLSVPPYLAPDLTVYRPKYLLNGTWTTSTKDYQLVAGFVKSGGLTLATDAIETLRSFVPSEIECVEGETFEVFLDSLTLARDHTMYNITYTGFPDDVFLYRRKLYISPVAADSGGSGSLIFKDGGGNVVKSLPITITPYPIRNPSTMKNVLVIGDSLTDDNRTMDTLYTRLSDASVTNVTLLGTRGNLGHHEGRAGWTMADYSGASSPFWDAGAGDINFIKYCTDHSYSGIDYCIVHLNWNDVIFNPDILAGNYETFCGKILRDYPNCKVFVVGLSSYPRDKFRLNAWYKTTKETVFNLSEAYETMVESHPNMDVLHLLHQIDVEYANVTTTIPVSVRNPSITEDICTDHVHGTDVEYDQIADAYFRKLMAQFNKDSV